MKRTVTAFLALALNSMTAHAQIAAPQDGRSACTMTEANAPVIRGVRLGMTIDQVVALFPGSSKTRETKDAIDRAKTAPPSETVHLAFDAVTDSRPGNFEGVNAVSVGLIRGRVIDFIIIYVGPSWRSIDEWVAKLVESLKLPGASAWVVGPNETPNKVLRCKGVEIEATIQGGGASVRLRNTEKSNNGGREDTANEESRRRRDFKP